MKKLIAGAAALGAAFAVTLPLAARDRVTPPNVPDKIRVLAPNKVVSVGHAIGTQNYVCLPAASGVAWSLFTPEATLFSDQERQLLTHFFSPNPDEPARTVRAAWQDSRDASTVWGEVVESSTDARFVAPGAIPWLLVHVVGRQDGPRHGDNNVTATTFIQRVATLGGAAPSTGCGVATDIGRKAFVPYKADYFFYEDPTYDDREHN